MSVMQAVREIRTALGDTQTQFGRRLGKSISTVLRYETLRPPKGKELMQIERLAREHNLNKQAEVLRAALDEEFGPENESVMQNVLLAKYNPKVRIAATAKQANDICSTLGAWLRFPSERPSLLTVSVKTAVGSFQVQMKNGKFTVTAKPKKEPK